MPPEQNVFGTLKKPRSGEYDPGQWHLTCAFEPAGAERRLVSVIVVGRASGTEAWPEPELLEGDGRIGARIGHAEVEFDVAAAGGVQVQARNRRDNGVSVHYNFTAVEQ